MPGIAKVIRIRKLHDDDGRAAFWASQSPARRMAALEIIRGTGPGSIHAQSPFPRIYRVVKKKAR